MTTETLGTAFRRLLRRMGRRPTGDLADGHLLDRFAARRDESAFAELVERHGPMVLGVCRRVLHDLHGAEDAFQATFLILARKAAGLEKDRSLGNWLYTVARNTALKARQGAARRRDHERQVAQMKAAPPMTDAGRDVFPILDAELGALPEKLRAPLVLCYLQGKTHQQAAAELGWPVGSMAKRLTHGLEVLRKRLAGRGVALTAPLLATLLAQQARAAVPAAAVQSVSRSAVSFAAGQTGAIPGPAAALAQAGLRGLAPSKLRLTVVLLLGFGLLGAAAAGVVWLNKQGDQPNQQAAGPGGEADPPPAEDPRVLATRTKLAKKINVDKGIDPNTPLKDALEFLADAHQINVEIDSANFEKHGVQKVEEQPVDLPRIRNVKLSSVLRMLLSRIKPEDGSSGFHIRPDGVVAIAVNVKDDAIEGPPEKGLVQALARPITFSVEADTPLADALEALVGLDKVKEVAIAIDAAEFQQVGIGRAEEMPVKEHRWTDVPLETVLRELLRDVEVDDQVVKTEAGELKIEAQVGSFVVREEYIEIVPIPRALLQTPLPARRLQECWDQLSHADPRVAFRASRYLSAIPDQAVPFLAQRVRPMPAPTAAEREKLARLIKDLESDEFAVRQRATAELEQRGESAEPALRQALAAKPTLDLRERLDKLLTKVNEAEWPRSRQAILVLERIGSPAARQVLRQLASGAADARLTREAQAAVNRLAE